jgi:transcriptional regulator with XRE-family HTH domain
MKTEPPKPPAPPRHPLRQLRDILGWSREKFAAETGISQATVQNIERGVAPLTEEAAFAIEAATSCNAKALEQSAETWRMLKNEEGELFQRAEKSLSATAAAEKKMRPLRLDCQPFTAQEYINYQHTNLPQEGVEGALQDLGLRLDLLLRPLAGQPHRFRRMYRYLVQVLNKARDEKGPTPEDMAAYAMTRGKAVLDTKTIGELMRIPEVAESPQWKTSRAVERFGPGEKAHLVHEQYPFWPEVEVLEDAETYLVPDHVFGERTVWRITLPDGKPLAIVINGTRAVGLQARLTDEMIEVKKEERAAKAKPKPAK